MLDEYSRGVLQQLNLDAQDKPFYTPALLAYMRGVGMSLSQAEDNRANAQFEAQRSYQQGVDELGRVSAADRKNLTAGLQDRGVLRSGEATNRYNEQDNAKARTSNALETTKSDRMRAIDTAYGQVEDTLRQQTTERLMTAEQDDADRRAVEEAQKRQQDQLTAYYTSLAGRR